MVIVVSIFLCGGIALGYFNSEKVSFNFLLGTAQLPLIVLLAEVFIAAVALTLLVVAIRIFALHAETRRLRKQLNDAESELKNLRNLPYA
ncbi:MAG TPA: LapA family protein [Nevskiaceae bacterium]|nr:LapA family protein [Nevskiaceae bacterium]